MSNVELLPLPSVLLNWPHPTNHAAIRDYARANVAHATAAKDAEIEALRAEVVRLRLRLHRIEVGLTEQIEFHVGQVEEAEAHAERLAEALRLFLQAGVGNSTDFYVQYNATLAARAALHPTAAQEAGND